MRRDQVKAYYYKETFSDQKYLLRAFGHQSVAFNGKDVNGM